MKTALVCIAKNEDHYIDEWIKYHTKLGFDFIYVYQNNWRYNGDKSQYNNVHWLEFDGDVKQLESYQNFIIFHSNEYDWTAFFDIDEYLCLKKYNNVKDFLKLYDDYNAIGINWRLFGNSGIANVSNNEYSLINRFKMADYIQNQHIKTILHTAKTRYFNISFCDPHSIRESLNSNFTINTKKSTFIHGPLNNDFDENIQLNHYYTKTLDEYLNNKRIRGRSDIKIVNDNDQYDISKFSSMNKNDIEDLHAYNFWNNI